MQHAAKTKLTVVLKVTLKTLKLFIQWNKTLISGMKCDIRAGRCVGHSYNLLLAKLKQGSAKGNHNIIKMSAIKSNSTVADRKFCPNHSFSCEEDQTCCPLQNGEYGCCPFGSDAVCCEDKQHCCPHQTVCDVQEGTCKPVP